MDPKQCRSHNWYPNPSMPVSKTDWTNIEAYMKKGNSDDR